MGIVTLSEISANYYSSKTCFFFGILEDFLTKTKPSPRPGSLEFAKLDWDSDKFKQISFDANVVFPFRLFSQKKDSETLSIYGLYKAI